LQRPRARVRTLHFTEPLIGVRWRLRCLRKPGEIGGVRGVALVEEKVMDPLRLLSVSSARPTPRMCRHLTSRSDMATNLATDPEQLCRRCGSAS